MSIFGTTSPRYVLSATNYDLDYAEVVGDWRAYNVKEHQSIINGFRSHINLGYHYEFVVDLNLSKYASPEEKFAELWGHRGASVQLYKHRDGSKFQDSSSADVDFYIASVTPYYLEESEYFDRVRITFKSKDYVEV